MELSLDLNRRYTYADYLTWLDDIRRELINGFIKMMSAPRLVHANVSANLSWLLASEVRKNRGRCKVFSSQRNLHYTKSRV